jgi:hypothetical protein
LVFGLEAERLHRGLELLGVNRARTIRVEQVERFANLFDFLLREAWPLVGLGGALAGRLSNWVGVTVGHTARRAQHGNKTHEGGESEVGVGAAQHNMIISVMKGGMPTRALPGDETLGAPQEKESTEFLKLVANGRAARLKPPRALSDVNNTSHAVDSGGCRRARTHRQPPPQHAMQLQGGRPLRSLFK